MAIDPVYDPKATSVQVLRYLVAVAEQRHFGRAAQACGVSQPTLSALVARWEGACGVQVFDRSSHGVAVTPAGERVVAAARRALDAIAQVEAAAGSAVPPFFGPVRLGVIPTVAPYLLPHCGPAWEKAFPDAVLPLREATTGECLDLLDRGQIDVAILAELPGMERGRVILPLYEEPFTLAVARGHRLAKLGTAGPGDLAGERILLLDDGHCLRGQVMSACRLREDAPRAGADYRATSLETLRHLVAGGAGVSLFPVLAVPAADPRVVFLPFADSGARRRIVACWRADDGRDGAYRLLGGPIRRAIVGVGVTPL